MHHACALTGVAQGQEYRTVRAAKFHGNDAGQIKADGLMPRAVPWKLREHNPIRRRGHTCDSAPPEEMLLHRNGINGMASWRPALRVSVSRRRRLRHLPSRVGVAV